MKKRHAISIYQIQIIISRRINYPKWDFILKFPDPPSVDAISR